jgi:hypothetical protein
MHVKTTNTTQALGWFICCSTSKKKNALPVTEYALHKGNNKITELRTILQRESQNS